ncbi:hypothetical protein CEXT_146581 [Caerostris extrusa]|uniref:Uncharacterized protein n=1 Tax=Caerostris extrusa TaxID=172846 RepID=A0AAV4NY22_CAEEX|nr:hypothetical protein CEXT_146581 [Caerostris extrusa]
MRTKAITRTLANNFQLHSIRTFSEHGASNRWHVQFFKENGRKPLCWWAQKVESSNKKEKKMLSMNPMRRPMIGFVEINGSSILRFLEVLLVK